MLVAADEGRTIQVRVSLTAAAGNAGGSLTSTAETLIADHAGRHQHDHGERLRLDGASAERRARWPTGFRRYP